MCNGPTSGRAQIKSPRVYSQKQVSREMLFLKKTEKKNSEIYWIKTSGAKELKVRK